MHVRFWDTTVLCSVSDFGEGFRVPSGVRKPLMQEPAVGILSYGVLWIGYSGGPPIAATVVSRGGSRGVFAGVIAEIFVVMGAGLPD
ncbi:hypothetical protein I7I49_17790 [Sinorhizobium meliloti]|uniref:hypothetical protein n=1 Tax=Rhizobium meliloti TaxID=382 RepID=UPI00237F64F4|nr:hypothetical protein [Sinorhizobium meliloti]MDE3812124.1 hypothetical protein [Sinorhizobium meliloti]